MFSSEIPNMAFFPDTGITASQEKLLSLNLGESQSFEAHGRDSLFSHFLLTLWAVHKLEKTPVPKDRLAIGTFRVLLLCSQRGVFGGVCRNTETVRLQNRLLFKPGGGAGQCQRI